MKKVFAALSMIAAGVSAQSAMAWEAGDIFVRAGVATVAPDESSGGIAVPALAGVGAYDGNPIAGTGVEIDNDTQLGLTATYMFTDSLGLELLAATPFTHKITADLGALGKVNAGEATHLPPTLSAVWYPMGSKEAFKPYVGAGLTYAIMIDTDVHSDLEAGLGAVGNAITGVDLGIDGPVPLNMELDDSISYSLQAGMDLELSESWHVNASIRYVDVNTDAKLTNKDLGTVITIKDIEIDPWVYQINIGYKF